MNGEVIGINAAKYSDTSVEGIGYAIPISQAKDIISDLMTKTTKVAVDENEQGYLGIQLQNIDSQMAQAYGMPEGIYVYKIVAGGAASRSDLRERDIITKFDGEKVKNGDDLKKLLTYYKAGSTVTMTVQSLEMANMSRETYRLHWAPRAICRRARIARTRARVNHRQVRRENWEDRKYPISEVGWNV